MSRVGGCGPDHSRFTAQQAVNFLDGVTQAVEKDDIVGRHLGFAPAVGHFGQERPGFRNPLGGAVAVGTVLHGQVGDDLLHPWRNHLPLGDRIANVLHIGLDAERLELVGNLDDSPDFVGQLAGTDMNDVVAHEVSSFPLPEYRPSIRNSENACCLPK